MSNFKNISISEMSDFLTRQGFQVINVPGTKETVFGKRMSHALPLTLRVYTGIENGISRECGADAIRCTLFWRNNKGEVKKAAGDKRVHRVTNWRKNLSARIANWNQDFVICNCGAPMIERKGKNGVFLGCCDYPNCRNTKPLKNEGERQANKHISLSVSELQAEKECLEIEGLHY